MNPGELRHKIQIYGKIKSINAVNQKTYIPSLLDTVWSNIMPQTGKMQNQQVNTILTNVTHKIIIRYNQTIESAYQDEESKKSMYAIFRGQRFNILYILNPYFRNEKLEIFTEEVIG